MQFGKKLYLFVFSFFIYLLTSTSLFCMLTKWQYPPLISPNDAFTKEMRTFLNLNPGAPAIAKKYPQITMQGTASSDEQDNVCGYYAIKKITGSNAFRSCTPGDIKKTTLFVENFFDQVKHPQPGDLVVYTLDQDNLAINHYAVVIDNELVEAKWGSLKKIFRGPVWANPLLYGLAAAYFTLKAEYRNESGNILFHKHLLIDHEKKSKDQILEKAKKQDLSPRRISELLKEIDKEVTKIASEYIKISNKRNLKW